MSCALAPDGVDDGGRFRISLGTWHGYACKQCTSTRARVGKCEVAFVRKCIHTCGKNRVDTFVKLVALHV